MKTILIILLFAIAPEKISVNSGIGYLKDTDYVWICTGPKSKCYHTIKNCNGLRRCSGKIKKMTLKKAKNIGRGKPCSFCYIPHI